MAAMCDSTTVQVYGQAYDGQPYGQPYGQAGLVFWFQQNCKEIFLHFCSATVTDLSEGGADDYDVPG